MDSPRRQRSISLCQPHSTTPHPSRVGVPTRLPDALGCRPSTAGGQGATLSTFPLVPLTREPTCTQAIDPGISRSTLTPADTSRPSRSSGHFPDFPWSGSPWLAHGSPLHGDWFPNPTGLLLRAFGLPSHPMSLSPLPHPGTGPFPASRGLPIPSNRCVALAGRPSPSRPLFPSSRVYTPPGRQQPCGAGPLDLRPSGDRFVRLARVAPSPPPPLSPVPRPLPNPPGRGAAPSRPSSRVYTPPGRQQPCGAGPLDPHPSGDRFVRLARVAPLPPPPPTPVPPPMLSLSPVAVAWPQPRALFFFFSCPLFGVVGCHSRFFFFFFTLCAFSPWFPPPCMHAQQHCFAICLSSVRCSLPVPPPSGGAALGGPRPCQVGAPPSRPCLLCLRGSYASFSPLHPPLPSVSCPPS